MSTLEEKLTGRGFIAHHFATGEEAARFVLESIPAGRSVGIGGSMTVKALRLDERHPLRGLSPPVPAQQSALRAALHTKMSGKEDAA